MPSPGAHRGRKNTDESGSSIYNAVLKSSMRTKTRNVLAHIRGVKSLVKQGGYKRTKGGDCSHFAYLQVKKKKTKKKRKHNTDVILPTRTVNAHTDMEASVE